MCACRVIITRDQRLTKTISNKEITQEYILDWEKMKLDKSSTSMMMVRKNVYKMSECSSTYLETVIWPITKELL